MEHWHNDTDREDSDKTMSQCHFIHDKSQTDWTGIESRPSWWREILIMFGNEQNMKTLITKISSGSCASKSKARCNISFDIWNKNQLMSIFQFYSYIAGSLHVSGPQFHLQESSHSCSHNQWFSVCTALVACSVCMLWLVLVTTL
jgi:hypothetical protein